MVSIMRLQDDLEAAADMLIACLDNCSLDDQDRVKVLAEAMVITKETGFEPFTGKTSGDALSFLVHL